MVGSKYVGSVGGRSHPRERAKGQSSGEPAPAHTICVGGRAMHGLSGVGRPGNKSPKGGSQTASAGARALTMPGATVLATRPAGGMPSPQLLVPKQLAGESGSAGLAGAGADCSAVKQAGEHAQASEQTRHCVTCAGLPTSKHLPQAPQPHHPTHPAPGTAPAAIQRLKRAAARKTSSPAPPR